MARTVQSRAFMEALAAIFLFGCIPVTIKHISVNAYTIGVFRLASAGLCLFLLLRMTGGLRVLTRKQWLTLAGLGILFGMHWMAYFFSIKVGSASIAAIGASTFGIQLVLLGWIFRTRRPGKYDVLALMIAVVGSLLIVPEFNLENETTMGLLLAVLGSFFYALLPIIHQKNQDLPHEMRALGQFLFALVFFAMFWPRTDWGFPAHEWWWLLFLGIACTTVAHTLWVRVTTVLPTTTSSVIFYLYLPVAMLLDIIILDAPVDARLITGAALIVTGSIIGVRRQSRA